METRRFELCTERELNPQRTFDCGQCFRWNEEAGGRYRGVASGRAAVVWAEGGAAYIECAPGDIGFWRGYLDMETDYEEARRSIEVCDYLRDCAAYGEGIRILRQDKWEALTCATARPMARAYASCGRTSGRRCARSSCPSATTYRG